MNRDKTQYVNAKLKEAKWPIKMLLGMYLLVVVILIVAALLSSLIGIPIEHFFADPALTLSGHPFIGMVSHAGIFLWSAVASICLFSSAIIWKTGSAQHVLFLFFSGLVSLALMVDDLFMLHEGILPYQLNISQEFIYIGYLIPFVGYLWYFRKEIFKSEFQILGAAIFLLSLSVIGDMVLPQEGIAYVIEDGFKIFGIATWFVYFVRLCFNSIQRNFDIMNAVSNEGI